MASESAEVATSSEAGSVIQQIGLSLMASSWLHSVTSEADDLMEEPAQPCMTKPRSQSVVEPAQPRMTKPRSQSVVESSPAQSSQTSSATERALPRVAKSRSVADPSSVPSSRTLTAAATLQEAGQLFDVFEDFVTDGMFETEESMKTESGEPQYEVEAILKHRGRGLSGEPEKYLVKWKDFPDSANSWEPAANLGAAAFLLARYWDEHGLQPHPQSRSAEESAKAPSVQKPRSRRRTAIRSVTAVAANDEAIGDLEMVTDSGKPLFEVEKILNHRGEGFFVEYRVKWKNYPSSDNSWEPAVNIGTPSVLLQQYWDDYKRKSLSQRRLTEQPSVGMTPPPAKKSRNCVRVSEDAGDGLAPVADVEVGAATDGSSTSGVGEGGGRQSGRRGGKTPVVTSIRSTPFTGR
ncbi:hypothetical protein BV898_10967 [Hypsibius exemplaris]|uniref:Chromo domain-containing protein n=1 Tax=Hypsibius exemplaris TaxID=2072580 RepID=A0A1W0WHY4_HYPEX|nr:hypothetical protein BV898_10967 [Hypsibius exemplaris]